jgi:AcrR family transcriptional regulator
MNQTVPTRRPGGRTAETRRRVFEATCELLVERGFPAVTFQEVAARAGVGRATLYRRWDDPAALVADAVRASAADRIQVADTGSLHGDLRRILELIAQFIASPLGSASLIARLAQSGNAAPDDALSYQWGKRWSDVLPIFERARDRGELDHDRDFEICFTQLAGAVYFRTLIERLPVDENWLNRLLQDGLGRANSRD